jgi:hypothetical protein
MRDKISGSAFIATNPMLFIVELRNGNIRKNVGNTAEYNLIKQNKIEHTTTEQNRIE